MYYKILAKRPAPPAYICEAAPRRGRFAPLASLAAAQRGSLRSRWLAGEVLRATQCINVARFARCFGRGGIRSATSEVKRPRRSFLTSELNSLTSITIRSIPILPLVRGHGLGGQTASEVIFDLRNELLGLRNHKIDTHIATIKRPWPPRS